MQTAIIVVSCLIFICIIGYVELLNFFYPQDLSIKGDLDLEKYLNDKLKSWQKS